MPTYPWYQLYKAALIEKDWTRMNETVQAGQDEIYLRWLELTRQSGNEDEKQALLSAISGLKILRMDAAEWRERHKGA